MKKIIIAAVSKNNVIGRSDSSIPWHNKEDSKHFKNTTLGFPVIMGRKTFDVLAKPLEGRLNIIITRNNKLIVPFNDVKIFNSINQSLEYCEKESYEKVYIIGGGEIFLQSMPLADEMIISFMKFDAEGDLFFPEIGLNMWKIFSKVEKNTFNIITFVRK